MQRNVDADYKAAYIAEYEVLSKAGLSKAAGRIADILNDEFGHDVRPKTKRAPRGGAKENAAASPPPETTDDK